MVRKRSEFWTQVRNFEKLVKMLGKTPFFFLKKLNFDQEKKPIFRCFLPKFPQKFCKLSAHIIFFCFVFFFVCFVFVLLEISWQFFGEGFLVPPLPPTLAKKSPFPRGSLLIWEIRVFRVCSLPTPHHKIPW